jgi:hypothetical protein
MATRGGERFRPTSTNRLAKQLARNGSDGTRTRGLRRDRPDRRRLSRSPTLRESGRQVFCRHVARNGKRHPEFTVTLQQPLRSNEREANDVALAVEADGVALRRLVEVGGACGIADVEVEHVSVGVVFDTVEVMIRPLVALSKATTTFSQRLGPEPAR